MSNTTYKRIGDTVAVIDIKLTPAVIDWQEILNNVAIEPDDWPESPWSHCEGYDHHDRPVNGVVERYPSTENAFYYYSTEGDGCRAIEVEYDQDLFDWYRERGASKQVADQLTRQSMRKRIEQLIDWYRNGWEWWQVRGEMHGCFASVGGIDDCNYANSLCRVEVTLELANELEATGYEVTGKPELESTTNHHSQLNLFNM